MSELNGRNGLGVFLCGLLVVMASAVCAAEQETDHVYLEGIIEPSEEVNLSSQVPGIVDQIFVERGDNVAKGQVLARLKSGAEQAEVELIRARVEFAGRKVVRNEELHRKELISVQEKDEMDSELKIAELQLCEAKERLDLRVIRSPVQGVVVERFLGPGEYVGEDAAIFKIACIDPLYVEMVVPVDLFGAIANGMRAMVHPESPIGGQYKAEVIIVDRVIDGASGTFGVRLRLPNPKHRLPAGLKCKVEFPKG